MIKTWKACKKIKSCLFTEKSVREIGNEEKGALMRKKKVLSLLLAIVMVFSMMAVPGVSAFGAQKATTENIGDVTGKSEDGNVLIFQVGG